MLSVIIHVLKEHNQRVRRTDKFGFCIDFVLHFDKFAHDLQYMEAFIAPVKDRGEVIPKFWQQFGIPLALVRFGRIVDKRLREIDDAQASQQAIGRIAGF